MPGRKRSWTIEQLKGAIKKSTSYRQVLIKLSLREAGGNYDQIKKYIKELKLNTRHFKGAAWNKGLTGIGKPRILLESILAKGTYFQSYNCTSSDTYETFRQSEKSCNNTIKPKELGV